MSTKRKKYSVEYKKKIVEDSWKQNLATFCKKKNLSNRLVRKWRAKYEKVHQWVEVRKANNDISGLLRQPSYSEFEDIAVRWIAERRAKGFSVSRSHFEAFTFVLTTKLELKESQNWINEFLQRHKLPARKCTISTSANTGDIETNSNDLARKNKNIKHSNRGVPNGIIIKQELVLEDVSNDEKPQDICLPVITSVLSEYEEFASKETNGNITNIKCEIDNSDCNDQYDGTSNADNELKEDSIADVSSSKRLVIKHEFENILPKFKRENDAIGDTHESELGLKEIIELSDCDSPKNEERESNDLLVPRAIKVVKVVRLAGNKKKIVELTDNRDLENNSIVHTPSLREFKCPVCLKTFRYEKSFRKHEQSHVQGDIEEPVPINDDLPFTRSNTKFKSDNINLKTVKNERPEMICKCWCGSTYEDRKQLIECIKNHGGYICSLCPTGFQHESDLCDHKLGHMNKRAKRFECTKCDMKFVYRNAFLKHKKVHLLNEQSNLVDDAIVHVNQPILENKRVSCEHCSTVFDNAVTLKIHIAVVHRMPNKATVKNTPPPKPIPTCNICSQTFSSITIMRKHKLTHERKKEGIYKCNICTSTFHNTKALNAHRRVHVPPKIKEPENDDPESSDSQSMINRLQYYCDICSQPFNSQVQMIRHKNTHPFITIVENDLTKKQIFYK